MYTTEAIVLSNRINGEANELVSLYTRDFGKLIVKARSSKKISTKQGTFLHKPSIVQSNFVSSRAGYILSGIKSIRGYTAITDNIYASAYLNSFLNLCDDIFYEGQKDEQIWELLLAAMEDAEQLASQQAGKERFWQKEKEWLILLLSILGLKPDNLKIDNIKNANQFDLYLQNLLQNKLERKINFFGLKSSMK